MNIDKTIHVNAKLQEKQLNEIYFFRYLKEHAHSANSNYVFGFSIALFKWSYIYFQFDNNKFTLFELILNSFSIGIFIFMIFHTNRHANETTMESSKISNFFYSLLNFIFTFNVVASLFNYFGLFDNAGWPNPFVFIVFEFSFLVFCLFGDELKCKIKISALTTGSFLMVIVYALCGYVHMYYTHCELENNIYFNRGYIIIFLAVLFVAFMFLLFTSAIANANNERLIKNVKEGKIHQNTSRIERVNKLAIEKNRQYIVLAINIICAILHIYAYSDSISCGWGQSYPALGTMLIAACCLVSAYYNIKCIRSNNTGVFPKWYNYLLAVRELGGICTLYTDIIIYFVFEGPEFGLLQAKWGLNWTVLILTPILLFIANLFEIREVKLKSKMIAATITNTLLIFERLGGNTVTYASYFSINGIATFDGLIGALSAACILYGLAYCYYLLDACFFVSIRYKLLDDHVKHNYVDGVSLYICGARNGIAPTSSDFYKFGQASNCYVVRDGNYGIIISCGSGLVYAPSKLKGCTSVDVFLTEVKFSTMMGLLVAPNPCPGAKIRIFGPFGKGGEFVDLNGFATPPLWPVNVIVGECVSINANQDVRLNDHYSVCYYANDYKEQNYSLRINGSVSIYYEGASETRNSNMDKLAENCDIMICKDDNNIEQVIEQSKSANVGYLLIGNHGAYDNDSLLEKKEQKAEISDISVDYLKQGDVYNIA